MSVLILIFFTGVTALFSGLYHKRKYTNFVVISGVLGALLVSFLPEIPFWEGYQKMFLYDESAAIFTRVTLFITLIIFIIGDFSLYKHRNHQSEIYSLILFSLCGGLIMLGFRNVITLFLGIEILSIPLYILAGSEKTNELSIEASVKYFLLGAFATGFLLFGFTLIYGSSGSLDLDIIGDFSKTNANNTMFIIGLLLVLGAMAFKIALAPFHLWSPDVYCGSPSWVTLYMASVVKIVGFYALFKLISIAFIGYQGVWLSIIWGLVCVTLLLASILGLVQRDVKRMLAYSSIANAGYMALIFFGVDEQSPQRLAFYLFSYSLATVGVFMGLIGVEKHKNHTSFKAFNRLARKNPFLSLCITISLLSMAGIPFTAGFMGKVNLFLQTVETSLSLVIMAVLASMVSIAYYLKLIMAMYFKKDDDNSFIKLSIDYWFTGIIVVLLILVLGIFPNLMTILY